MGQRRTESLSRSRLQAVRQGGTYAATLRLGPGKQYEYQLVEEGPTVRSGVASQVPSEFYSPGRLRLQGMAGGNISGELFTNFTMTFTQGPVYFDFFKVKEVRARIIRDGQLVKIDALHPVLYEYKETYWNLDLDNVIATEIILQVEYEDGATEELKAWPDPEGMEYEIIRR